MSSFSSTYTQHFDTDEFSSLSNSLAMNEPGQFEAIPSNVSIMTLPSIPEDSYELVQYYLSDVLNVQASRRYLEIGHP